MRIFAAKSVIALAASLIWMPISAYGQERPPLKIGLILPYNGVYAVTAQGIDHGFHVALAEYGGKVAGPPIDIVRADDELTPSVGVQQFNKLLQLDKVDFIAGVVGSNVGIALSGLAEKAKKPTIFANTFADEIITGKVCNQDYHLATQLADRVCVLSQGRVQFAGTTQALIEQVRRAYLSV